MSARRWRRARTPKPTSRSPRLLRGEALESRTVPTAVSPLANLYVALPSGGISGLYGKAAASTPPTVAKAASAGLSAAGYVTGTIAPLWVLGSDAQGESSLIYNWKVTSAPAGGAATFVLNGSNTAKNNAVIFSEAGTYGISVTIVDRAGLSVTSSLKVPVAQTLSGIWLFNGATCALLNPAAPLTSTGTSQSLISIAVDQFGNTLATQPSFTWSAASYPNGAMPSLTAGGPVSTVCFHAAGSYGINVVGKGNGIQATASMTILVKQTLSSIVVAPGTLALQAGATQQFSAQGFDQFQQAMAPQPSFAWFVGGGTVSPSGLFTAPGTAGMCCVAAASGAIAGPAWISVTVPPPAPPPPPAPAPSPSPGPATVGLQDPALAALVQKRDADGSLNRADMIQILSGAGSGGTVSATDLSDLRTILAHAAQYGMPSYVQVLVGDVVNGSPANAHYQGAALGNLAAGSSAAQLNKLISKWFYGSDLPALNNAALTYATASGSLFPTTPSHNDEFQGELGDCYFVSALGTIADSNPAAIANMFINNGDGTYTVRFYGGTYGVSSANGGGISDGFTNNAGTADYVTVNCSLAAFSNGQLAYSDFFAYASSPTNALWIPLAEKAYAQWNETGKEGRDGKNAFSSIEGGWMSTVDAQVLGQNATDYKLTASTRQAMINALAAGRAVTIATDAAKNSGNTLPYALYGSHAYAVIGYDAGSDLFTLYNPWGCDQPGVLSWSQLETTCSEFVVADATGSAPIGGAELHSSVAAAASHISAAVSGASTPPSATTNLYATADWTTSAASGTIVAATSAPAGGTIEEHAATIVGDAPAAPDSHDSNAESLGSPDAAGVDAVFLALHAEGV